MIPIPVPIPTKNGITTTLERVNEIFVPAGENFEHYRDHIRNKSLNLQADELFEN